MTERQRTIGKYREDIAEHFFFAVVLLNQISMVIKNDFLMVNDYRTMINL